METQFRDHVFGSDKSIEQGRVYLTCPACSNERSTTTKRRKEVLAVSFEGNEAVYYCNHCNISGHVWRDERRSNGISKSALTPLDWSNFSLLGEDDLSYLSGRGIDAAQLDLRSSLRFFPEIERAPAIGFPYVLDENIKWIARERGKENEKFVQWEVKGGGAGLYRREAIDFNDPCLVICEGEIDTESVRHLGFNGISSANGAPTGAQAQKALKSIHSRLDSFSRIVIAMDDDDKGQAATEALVDLVGRKRAHTIVYPAGCKDLNDILVRFGPDALRSVLTNSEPSMSGIIRAREFFPNIDTLRKDGFAQGGSVGIESVDELITWHPGLCIVTGVPGSGKSEFVDQVAVSLSENSNWKWAVFSPENSGELHVSKLAAKRARAPIIGEEVLADEEEYRKAREWVDERFLFLPAESGTSVDSILDRADACVAQLKPEGCFGLIIDPWNYVSQSDVSADETSRVNSLLAKLQVWSLQNNALCFVVAHPTKSSGMEGNLGPYSIAGSAHWFNRATYLLALEADKNSFETDVHVHKVRFKWYGRTGCAGLTYDLSTGRYQSRMGDTKTLDEIDWDEVEKGDSSFEENPWEHDRTGTGETEDPEPPEARQLDLKVEVKTSDEPVPF